MDLTTAVKEMHGLKADLAAHIEAAKAEEARIRSEIRARALVLDMSTAGIDLEKVALAKTIITVRGMYAQGGEDRASVIADAIKQMATGIPSRPVYSDLWRVQLGTKSYDRWHGQRCDCEYFMGPRHGSLIFQVGLTQQVRDNRKHSDLTPEEIEASVYYLANLERIQAAEATAKAQAAA